MKSIEQLLIQENRTLGMITATRKYYSQHIGWRPRIFRRQQKIKRKSVELIDKIYLRLNIRKIEVFKTVSLIFLLD